CEVRAGHGVSLIGIRDRLTLKADFLALDRHGGSHIFGGDVLAKTRPSGRSPFRPDVEPLLRTGHGIAARARRSGGVNVHAADAVHSGPRAHSGAWVPSGAWVRVVMLTLEGAPVLDAVVLVKPFLLVRVEVPVFGHAGSVLDVVLAVGNQDVVALNGGPLQRNERFRSAEKTGFDCYPCWLPRVVIGVERADCPNLVPLRG